MKRKGFTLTELLGVIVILGALATITVPIVTNQINKNKTKLCVTQYTNILKAARAYGAEHINELEVDNTITLQNLINGGYIKSNITDPVTKDKISSSLQIKIIKNNNEYEYYIVDNDAIGCSEDLNIYTD